MSKQSKLFTKLVRNWTNKVWISWWRIELCYYSNKKFAKIHGYKKNKARRTPATCDTNWSYLLARIRVNKTAIKTMPDEKIEEIVVHELMHIFLSEMREKGIGHEERVATLLARSFISCDSYERGKE